MPARRQQVPLRSPNASKAPVRKACKSGVGSLRPATSNGPEIHALRSRLTGPAPPADFDDLRNRLRRSSACSSASLAVVARFAASHPHEIAFGTVRAIAATCGVSSTTVFRLALALGFESFQDMRNFFRAPLRQPSAKTVLSY